jgi:hypothetical protein
VNCRAVALAAIMLFAKSELFAQQAFSQKDPAEESGQQPSSLLPHPFVYSGAGLMGAGYVPLAWEAGGGLRIDSAHLLASAEGWYDDGHKTNDGTGPNPKGHDRGLDGAAYFRFSSGWFAGAGARWSQLSTTNYTKGAWRPTFGGGKDYFRNRCAAADCVPDFSMRLSVDYVLPGADKANALQGPLLSFYLPSPAAKGHIFFRQTLGVYSFHETVTNPSDLMLTRQQIGDRSVTSFGELTIMFRF